MQDLDRSRFFLLNIDPINLFGKLERWPPPLSQFLQKIVHLGSFKYQDFASLGRHSTVKHEAEAPTQKNALPVLKIVVDNSTEKPKQRVGKCHLLQ